MPYARKLASEMIERGFKSVEICQAYVLLAHYNTPTERFEDDRTYTYAGLAIRMAVELNLWRNPRLPPELDEETRHQFQLEALNRERTWLEIFIMDVSAGTHVPLECECTIEHLFLHHNSAHRLCRTVDRIACGPVPSSDMRNVGLISPCPRFPILALQQVRSCLCIGSPRPCQRSDVLIFPASRRDLSDHFRFPGTLETVLLRERWRRGVPGLVGPSACLV